MQSFGKMTQLADVLLEVEHDFQFDGLGALQKKMV